MTGGQAEGPGRRRIVFGHVSALLVILMWGTTFVSTKVLLVSFQPAEIMFFRFLLAYAALWILYPHKPQIGPLRRELLYLLAGLCGVTGYFLMENFALTYSYASNVSILISVAPMVTGIFAHFLLKNERLHWRFFLGFVVAIGGISHDNILELKNCGLDGVAVVSALFAQADVKAAAEELLRLSEEIAR